MSKKRNEYTNTDIFNYLKTVYDSQQKEFDNIHERLDKMNGQIAENTKFRLIHIGAYKLICIIGTIITVVVGWTLNK